MFEVLLLPTAEEFFAQADAPLARKSEPDGYLYPASSFAPIELPESAQRALMAAGG